ncbi:hypothetical protein VTK73DRAFT_476 [Phialemonium thermophilum]|uniref:Uncharacterized protein n=1 Tax=Phialemonium thermophilum TaxID=223376 RepID=A0ABR3XEI0_9PEZI
MASGLTSSRGCDTISGTFTRTNTVAVFSATSRLSTATTGCISATVVCPSDLITVGGTGAAAIAACRSRVTLDAAIAFVGISASVASNIARPTSYPSSGGRAGTATSSRSAGSHSTCTIMGTGSYATSGIIGSTAATVPMCAYPCPRISASIFSLNRTNP